MEIEAAGKIMSFPRRRERCLLAVLLLEANRVVSVDRLAELMWEGDSPKRVRGAVQGHASRLRAMLGRAGNGDGGELVFAGDGYRLNVNPDSVDAHRFQRLLDQAATVTDLAARADKLRTALDLWRGPALADAVSGLTRDRLCSGLEEQRLSAFEEFASTCLALRREREVLPELARFAGGNPARESLVELHMRALFQAGRRADALEIYARARAFLRDELGIDPGPELRELHRSILRGHLAAPTRLDSPQRSTPIIVPRQLPADVAGFTGRGAQLAQLGRLSRDGAGAASVVISAIGGTAGVGKTALAVHAAHRMAHSFPDGQLFIDLHGFTDSVAPVEPGDALDRLLRALDVPGERIPVDLDDRAALWRSTLAERRILILLDNAATEAQVAPLLPGAPGCLVLITSRRHLTALDATHTISLDTLPVPDALTLFARTAGEERLVDQSSELVSETVELCGRLPLAIRIAAGRLRSHPTWGMAELVERLRDQDQLLSELEDGTRGVAAALTVSYQRLATDPQHMYRLLGLHPGLDIDPYAAAALANTSVAAARRCLDQLHDTHLLQEPAAGRFAFHDLVRAHAHHTAAAVDAELVRRAALTRLLDYYRHTASVAMDMAYPYERDRRPRVPPAGTAVPDLSDPVAGTGWLDIELHNLLAVVRRAANDGWPTYVLDLSGLVHRHLGARDQYRDAEMLHIQALTIARAAGSRTGELEALVRLGDVRRMLGRIEQATADYQRGLRLARNLGHRAGELDALTGLGHLDRRRGRSVQAAEHYQQALQIARATDHRTGELNALTGLGHLERLQGRHDQATEHYQRALQVARANRHHTGEMNALTGLGWVHVGQGRHEQAAEHYQQALQIADAAGHRAGEVNALIGLGVVHRLQGEYKLAADHYRQALQIADAAGQRNGELAALSSLGVVHRLQGQHKHAADYSERLLALAQETGERNWEFEARQNLGRLQHATGQTEAALANHRQALALATDLRHAADQARAHDGLAHAYEASAQPQLARRHWQEALGVLTSLGTDHTEDRETNTSTIRAHLAALASADLAADSGGAADDA